MEIHKIPNIQFVSVENQKDEIRSLREPSANLRKFVTTCCPLFLSTKDAYHISNVRNMLSINIKYMLNKIKANLCIHSFVIFIPGVSTILTSFKNGEDTTAASNLFRKPSPKCCFNII